MSVVLAIGILFLSVIRLVRSQNILVWLLSLIATEYGHFFALLCFVLVSGARLPVGAASLLFLAAILFLLPLEQAFRFKHPTLHQPVRFSKIWIPFRRAPPRETYVYSKRGDSKQYLDLYRPAPSEKYVPWILIIHGGAWKRGTPRQLAGFNSELVKRGYAVACVSYRLLPEGIWPAQRDDILEAIRFIKEKARDWRIDADRWVILGRSAGGQLAENVAYSVPDSSLKGCISFYAPSDMMEAYETGTENDLIKTRPLLREYLGGYRDLKKATYEEASAIRFVSAKSPPTLLFHGDADPIVPIEQSLRLHQALEKNGVKSTLIRLPWATHAFDFNPNGPSGQIATRAVSSFLRRVFPA
jgi:acetyl esterase/lipase